MSIGTETIEEVRAPAGIEAGETMRDVSEYVERRALVVGRQLPVWTAALIAALVLAVATDRLGLRVGSFNVRGEFIVGGLVALAALIRQGMGALRTFGLIDICLAGWLVVNLVSSLLFSPDRGESLKNVALVAGLLAIYAAARLLIKPGRSLEWSAVVFVGAGAIVAFGGLVCALLYHLIGPNPGLILERFYRDDIFVVTPKVQSILWEPNIYGSFSLAVGALTAALTLARLRFGSDDSSFIGRLPLWVLYLSGALGMCGVMLSMTRTVWVVGPPLVVVMAIVAWKVGLANARTLAACVLLPALVGGIVGLGVGLSLPAHRWEMGRPWDLTQEQINEMVRERLFGKAEVGGSEVTVQPTMGAGVVPTATPMPIGNGSAAGDRIGEVLSGPGEAPSLTGRWRVFSNAFEGWLRMPILGWGAGAFPLVYPPPLEGGYWIANIELHTLFDTGIVGLALLATAAILAGWRAFQAILYPTARWNRQAFVTFGLLSAGIGLLTAFQVTDGSWLGFTWVLLGMVVAGGAGERGTKREGGSRL